MYLFWIAVTFGMLAGGYALVSAETAPSTPSVSTQNLAMNMSQYRQAVVAFAVANPGFSGSVPPGSLQPYLASSTPDPVWRNYVAPDADYAGSLVVIYAASASAGSVVPEIEQLAQGSALAGVAFNQTVVSPGNLPVALPDGVAGSVPNGVPVWMAQAYE
ncbi:type IV pilus biogenesis protein PilM [Paraburkholderia sp. 2C]|jgi:type IV pilus assembly PilM-like protein